jgi:poly-gamma-glutamate synthesis protein (capsule biosynthesis protein)
MYNLLLRLGLTISALFIGVGGMYVLHTESPSTIESRASTQYPHEIVFVGDIMLGRHVERLMEKYGAGYPLANWHWNASTSIVVANFEAAIPKLHVPTPDFGWRFSVATSSLVSLMQASVTHVSLANNHGYDFGAAGYQNSRDALQASGIVPFGHPHVLDLTHVTYATTSRGVVALIGISTLHETPTDAVVHTLIEEVSRYSALQIVYVHWGEEYNVSHNVFQRQFATRLVSAGADLVIGHHPHVVQDIQRIDGVLVFYSLGNFVFDQYFSRDVQEGLLLIFDLESDEVVLTPVSSVAQMAQPAPMADYARNRFLTQLALRSDPELSSGIESGRILRSLVATSTETAIISP